MTSIHLRDRIILIALIKPWRFLYSYTCMNFGVRNPSCIASEAGYIKVSPFGNKTAPYAHNLTQFMHTYAKLIVLNSVL